MATERDVQNVKMERRNCEPMLRNHVWPALGKRRTPGDILYWPRDDQVVPFTHWAVYIGRRKLAPHGQSWMVDRCEVTGAELPEAVVHLWGAADSSTRDISRDAVVVYNRVDEVGGTPYDGNLEYDARHTPMKPAHILDRCLRALSHKVYEARFGGYHVLGNNCEHFATWARYGWNQSAQVNGATWAGAVGLGTLIGGPIGGMFGYALHGIASKEIGSLRRAQSNNFKDHPEDPDEEVDWVGTRSCETRRITSGLLDEEARAYAKRREHLPRGATLTPDEEEAEERKRTLLHFDSRSARLNVADGTSSEANERLRARATGRGGTTSTPPSQLPGRRTPSDRDSAILWRSSRGSPRAWVAWRRACWAGGSRLAARSRVKSRRSTTRIRRSCGSCGSGRRRRGGRGVRSRRRPGSSSRR